MGTVSVDGRGRVYIPKQMHESQGERFRIFELENSIKLVPVAEDPVEGLRDAIDADDIDLDELGEEVAEKARQELDKEF
jgi:bifunctional DNA-binding transcriptional regulator/antitoxin component of YhaV-PrlF toxin-antitoxin module